MQKKLIALAVAGLVSGGAFAQSNVTISGQMKVSVDNIRAGGATLANSDLTSRTRVVDNNSNLRFSGTETLGSGLTAFWQVESAIGTDNNNGTTGSNTAGTNTATIGTRNTAVGLRGNFGEVLLGKWDTHYNALANADGAGLVDGLALAANSLNLLNSINGTAVTGSTRNNNVIRYQTPNMSGFVGALVYGTGSELTTPGMSKKDSLWSLRLAYDNGPIAVAYSYLANNGAGAVVPTVVPVNTGNGNDIRSNRLGAAYSFPMGLKVGLVWDKSKNTDNSGAASTSIERSAWALPVSYTMGANKVSFTYGKTNNANTQAGSVASSSAKMTMLGYEYSLSKRTSLSATYAQINNDAAGRYDFWHFSSNAGGLGGGSGALAAGQAGADPRMLSFGMRHTF